MGKIIHDKDSMWLASWMDFLTQKKKICMACRYCRPKTRQRQSKI